ncbi:MAG: UDP-galactopyranose mutase [Rhizobacter sp.]|jgi:UDP-galactopyranose mutase
MQNRTDLFCAARQSCPASHPSTGFDYLVVGAGFAGAVLAERLARQLGLRVLIVEKRAHIGGNAHDRYDDHGVLIHPYGPHIFHTNAPDIRDYLSLFTAWRPYEHRVLASVDGQLLPIPINLDTVNRLYGMDLTAFEMAAWLDGVAEKKTHVRNSEDVIVDKVGRELYNKFFRGYTRKQWGLDPSELDASVTARVPTRTNRDNRYFTDTFQAIPLHGYTRMFEKMLDHPNIKIMLNTDYREVVDMIPWQHMIYTGPIDAFFDYRHGPLPYRSLRFEHRNLPVAEFQAVGTVNFPNDQAFTRVSEFKHITGQQHPTTSVVYEYPSADGDPYYPVPRPENATLYRRYEEDAEARTDVTFVGRLATYKYYNMDQVVAQALTAFKRLRTHHETAPPSVPSVAPTLADLAPG